MSDQQVTEKRAENQKVPSTHGDVDPDIEDALSFIDSEEYQEVPASDAGTKPSTPHTDVVQPVQEEDSKNPGDASLPGETPQRPVEKPILPPADPEEKKGSKLWVFLVVAAILIVLAIFFLL